MGSALAVLAALFCYILLFRSPGTSDVDEYWMYWTRLMRDHGVIGGYAAAHCDYPPLVFVLLHGIAHVATALRIDDFRTLKAAVELAAVGGGIVFWFWCRNLWLTAAFLIVVVINSAAQFYLDAFYLAPLLLALWALQRHRIVAAGFLLAVSAGMKWQPLIVAPFFLLQAYKIGATESAAWRRWLRTSGEFAAGALFLALPILTAFGPIAVLRSLEKATSHAALSFQALNLNWIVQMFLYKHFGLSGTPYYTVPVPFPLHVAAKSAFFLGYAFFLLVLWRRGRTVADFLGAACAGAYTYYALNIGVHENHLFVAMIMAFALWSTDPPRLWPGALYLGIIANLNLVLFYGLHGRDVPPVGSVGFDTASILLALMNLYFLMVCFRIAARRWRGGVAPYPAV